MHRSPLAASFVDQNSPHGLGCSPEKMTSTVPVLDLLDIHKSQVSVMDQCRRLQGLTRLFTAKLRRGQFA